MDKHEYSFKARVWIYEGPTPWYFVTVPKELSSEIRQEFRDVHRGWGSLPLEVSVGRSIWSTSMFWEKKGTYILPIKKEIRDKEEIKNNELISLKISIKG